MSMGSFRAKSGNLDYPIFFPDATQAVVKTLDSVDIVGTKTPGVLVNTYHLYRELGFKNLKAFRSVANFMNWKGGIISDSGGFQIMSIARKQSKNPVSDAGVRFRHDGNTILFTPEISMEYQVASRTDLCVVLDDITMPNATRRQARESVDRTVLWAARSKKAFEKALEKYKVPKTRRPYLIGVIQGGEYLDLRRQCAERLTEIGFDGFGYGGWPVVGDGFNFEIAQEIKDTSPKNYLLYGLGIGKPQDIIGCVDIGFHIFDCVLPTRDARHKRLYVYNASSIDKIDIRKKNFYEFWNAGKLPDIKSTDPVSRACDCLLCTNYSRGYLTHLFRIKEMSAMRLASIHNLRFYSILMEKLREELD